MVNSVWSYSEATTPRWIRAGPTLQSIPSLTQLTLQSKVVVIFLHDRGMKCQR